MVPDRTATAYETTLPLHCRQHYNCTADNTATIYQTTLPLHSRQYCHCTAGSPATVQQTALQLHTRDYCPCTLDSTATAYQTALPLHNQTAQPLVTEYQCCPNWAQSPDVLSLVLLRFKVLKLSVINKLKSHYIIPPVWKQWGVVVAQNDGIAQVQHAFSFQHKERALEFL